MTSPSTSPLYNPYPAFPISSSLLLWHESEQSKLKNGITHFDLGHGARSHRGDSLGSGSGDSAERSSPTTTEKPGSLTDPPFSADKIPSSLTAIPSASSA
ncbi:hypothetical protein HPP92_013340 [Vanilla planifolia]|uniref:Uncharacterized protein n=1 Tax=Vanilla planifolia TaxID=51239 RepID=A0A835UUQ4_VANPL|nr:hypothetical protein HPP92_013340 [Vanilla planifolia]